MKRRVEESIKPSETVVGYPASPLSPPAQRITPRTLTPVGHIQPSYAPTIKPTSELRGVQAFNNFTATMPAVTPTIKPSVVAGLQGGAQPLNVHTLQGHPVVMRHKVHSGSMTPPVSASVTSTQQQQQIQRLKVEDALSYLDMVKFKFGDQPQVYNDFLDIMKEFKSQSIDTPGVIDRVSSLFNGHPELIVGFNTFLPPGYKIEVKTNEQGYSFQVLSPSASTTTLLTAAPAPLPPAPSPAPLPPQPTVVSKPLILTNTTIVSHTPVPTAAAAAVVAPPTPQVTATTPPHFPNHAVPSIITQVQAHQAVSQALSHVESPQPTPQSQPVEFNHAINYVNKIKNRFQGQPDKYKRFLEILHTYQKEQRNLKEGGGGGGQAGTKQLTEAEVYSQVAKLFEHQDDLLAEFGQFLPDATSHQTQLARRSEEPAATVNRKPAISVKMSSPFSSNAAASPTAAPASTSTTSTIKNTIQTPPMPSLSQSTSESSHSTPSSTQTLKRSPSLTLHQSSPSTSQSPHQPPVKKHKPSISFRDVSLAEAAKYGTLTDFAFFDKVRKALRSQEVYDNFLRCVNLYTLDVVNRTELLSLVTPFLGRFPDLFRWFKEYIGEADGPQVHLTSPPNSNISSSDSMMNNNRPERSNADQSEIDLATCKRLGASYCAMPKNHYSDKCSGRTALCREVLNDTWASFPTWSEESTFVTSRKTQYEEYMYRVEDERFELDVVLEVNSATIRVLESVHKKLCRMTTEEVAKYHLDDCLGGSSPTIHQRALFRVYGDKGIDVIEGLKKNPVVAIPVVLRRLKAKEEEWRVAKKSFNKIWREQNEKYYLKSLDHQGINFKQNDMKALRSKSLLNEIETCYDERHEQADAGDQSALQGPHMTLNYKDRSVLNDAANLLIHHVKRQTGIHKDDKARIKHMLRQLIPDMFHHPRQELSEDEREQTDDKAANPVSPSGNESVPSTSKSKSTDKNIEDECDETSLGPRVGGPRAMRLARRTWKMIRKLRNLLSKKGQTHDTYTLFFGNGNWYLFFRLHQIICDRLSIIYEQCNILAEEEQKNKKTRSDAVAQALRLKPKSEYLADIEIDDYYLAFLDMVKNVLDGNMDINAYEDTLREMFSIHAYHAFTMDKVIIYAVRQLQHLVTDEACVECVDLYNKARVRGGAGCRVNTAHTRVQAEAAYQRKVETALAEENCFKMYIYKIDCKLTIELLDSEGDENDNSNSTQEADKWSAYVERYSKSAAKRKDETMDMEEEGESEAEKRMWGKAIFLPRNVRTWHERVGNNKHNAPKIDSCDESECRFNLNSYKMVFVLDRESYLYKRQALQKARQTHKQLSYQMRQKFQEWHERWARSHLSPQQHDQAEQWMLGKLQDYKANITVILTDNPLDKPPYRSYNRYRVRYLDNK